MIRRIRDLNQTLKYPVAIMLDTQGPEIRTGFNEVNLEVGDELRIRFPHGRGRQLRSQDAARQLSVPD